METILIVEDEPEMREELAALVAADGRQVLQASDGRAALEALSGNRIDLVLADIRMPGMDGLELLRRTRPSRPEIPFIMITAFASTETAVAALRGGAYDYITKPFSIHEVRNSVNHALQTRRLFREVDYLRGCLRERYSFGNILGKSAPMQRVFDLIMQVAPNACNVLITGESGTGKELVAQAIHHHSPRSKGKFLPVNCGALPETLLESELFGYVRGAFTGAVGEKEGMVQEANHGTLFLDEIGDMPHKLQVGLLRVIQNREVRKLGSTGFERVDVRIIAATNQNLEKKVVDKSFRDDLYYRIKVVEIGIPPLRDRAEDIPLLAEHFLTKCAQKSGKHVTGIAPEVHRAFRLYGWPGNVRELENVIERAVVLCTKDIITLEDLPPAMSGSALPELDSRSSLEKRVARFERHSIERALATEGGNVVRTARSLALSPSTLYRKMKKHGIELPADRADSHPRP